MIEKTGKIRSGKCTYVNILEHIMFEETLVHL